MAASLLIAETPAPVTDDSVLAAELLPSEAMEPSLADRLARSAELLAGGLTLLVFLSIAASLPVLHLLAFGYLLEISGRVARSGTLAAALAGLDRAARFGIACLGIVCTLLPVVIAWHLAAAAALLDPAGVTAASSQYVLWIATTLATLHIASALYCGGGLAEFFWPLFQPFHGPAASLAAWHSGASPWPAWSWLPPIRLAGDLVRGEAYGRAADRLWEFFVSLELPYLFTLGLAGYVGSLLWMSLPGLLLWLARSQGGVVAFAAGIPGVLLASAVLLHLPLLQANYAAEQRLAALFDLAAVRAQFQRAPLPCWFALAVTLVLSLPLFWLTTYDTQDIGTWGRNALLLLGMLPGRLAIGWAVGCGREEREPPELWRWSFWTLEKEPAPFLSRGSFWGVEVPLVVLYAVCLFFLPELSVAGSVSLWHPPAVLIPR